MTVPSESAALEDPRKGLPTRLAIALSAATTLTLTDLAASWLYGITPPIDLSLIATGIPIFAGLALVVCLCGGIVCGIFLRRSNDPARAFAHTALGLSAAFLIVRLAYADYIHGNLPSANIFDARVSIALLALGALTLIGYALHRSGALSSRIASHLFRASSIGLVYAIPMLLAFALSIVAYNHIDLDSMRSGLLKSIILAFAVSALTFLVFRSIPPTRPVIAIISILTCAFIILAPAVATLLPAGNALTRSKWPQQHILLLTVDTLRADALSSNSADAPETPAMDALASDGIRFTNAHSPSSWTVPALASIMTGLSPLTHDTRGLGGIDDACLTLAEIFVQRGYFTGAIGMNPQFHPGGRNMEQGFARYRWFPRLDASDSSFGTMILRKIFPKRWPLEADTTTLVDQAIRWYQSNATQRTFLWLHIFDPHLPYTPPSRYLTERPEGTPTSEGFDPTHFNVTMMRFDDQTPEAERESIRDFYRAEVRYVDDEIGRLVKFLKDNNLYDDMLIAFTADHGEELWEHGGFAHGHTLHAEVIRVPMIVKPPNFSNPVAIEEPVSTINILPTLLNLCGIDLSDLTADGSSLVPMWSPGAESNPQPIFIADTLFAGDQRSVIHEGYKLIVKPDQNESELYNLASDPGEYENLIDSDPERAQQLRDLLNDFEARAAIQRDALGISTFDAQFNKKAIDQLRSLGYF